MAGAGKGDRYRDVNRQRWDENYERIYGTGKAKKNAIRLHQKKTAQVRRDRGRH